MHRRSLHHDDENKIFSPTSTIEAVTIFMKIVKLKIAEASDHVHEKEHQKQPSHHFSGSLGFFFGTVEELDAPESPLWMKASCVAPLLVRLVI